MLQDSYDDMPVDELVDAKLRCREQLKPMWWSRHKYYLDHPEEFMTKEDLEKYADIMEEGRKRMEEEEEGGGAKSQFSLENVAREVLPSMGRAYHFDGKQLVPVRRKGPGRVLRKPAL